MTNLTRLFAAVLLSAVPALAASDFPCEYVYYESALAQPRSVVYGSGFPALGHAVQVQLHGAAPNRGVFLLTGSTPVDTLLAPGVALLVQPQSVQFAVTDAAGFVQLPLTIPDNPGLVGAQVRFQWIVLDTAGTAAESSTRGMAVTVVAQAAPLIDERAFDGTFELTLADRTQLTSELAGHVGATLMPANDAGQVDFSLGALGGETGRVSGPLGELPRFQIDLTTPLHTFDDATAEAGFEVDATVSLVWETPLDPNLRDPGLYPAWTPFTGTLRWDRLVDQPRITFSGTSAATSGPGGLAALGGNAGLGGASLSFTVLLDPLQGFNNKVKKKEQCIYVFITRKSNGTAPSATMQDVQAAITKASETWCEQCCIQLKVGNPDTDGDQNPDPCFLDDDDWQNPNRADAPITYALMVLKAQDKLKAAGKDKECVALIFVSNVGDDATLGEAEKGGTVGVIENITDKDKFGHVVAHEMGHIFGNGHPEEDPQENPKRSATNLMRGGSATANNQIHAEQCDKARKAKLLKCLDTDCKMVPTDTTPVVN